MEEKGIKKNYYFTAHQQGERERKRGREVSFTLDPQIYLRQRGFWGEL